MKKILYITTVLFTVFCNAQVGINTKIPVNALDINADLNVRKEIRVGGTDAVKGFAGEAGTIFHNNTDLIANDWKSIKIADGLESMSLFSMNTLSDKQGVSFSGNGSTAPYAENAPLNNNVWQVLAGTSGNFSITNLTNKVVFTFQTTAQKTGSGSSGFACGIFVDDELRAVRTDVLLGVTGAIKIFNLNATLTDIKPKDNYTVKVACTPRNLNGGTLGLGKAVNANFLNADMSQSVLTTSVLQPY